MLHHQIIFWEPSIYIIKSTNEPGQLMYRQKLIHLACKKIQVWQMNPKPQLQEFPWWTLPLQWGLPRCNFYEVCMLMKTECCSVWASSFPCWQAPSPILLPHLPPIQVLFFHHHLRKLWGFALQHINFP